jgi:hypothetical protein
MTDQSKFQKSLEALDLQGLILLQGLLAQRALQLLTQSQPEKKIVPAILVPQ